MIDMIVPRAELRIALASLLRLYSAHRPTDIVVAAGLASERESIGLGDD